MLTTVFLGLLAVAPTPAPLPATGKWVVDNADNACTLTHDFGPTTAPVSMTLHPVFMTQTVEMRLSTPDTSYAARQDRGVLTIGPSGRAIPVQISSYGPVTGGRRITSFWIEDVAVSALIVADSLVLDRGRAGAAIAIAPKGSAHAVAALQTCEDDVLKSYGIDAVAQRSLSRQPSPVGGAESKWFKSNDYPKAARGNYRGGRAEARVTVGATGGVTDCAVVESAGNPDLDDATCRILRERGRYEPALDAAGKPAAAARLVRVRWTMFR